MVKQDFKNNPVIGMCWKQREASPSGQRRSRERRGSVRVESHLAPEMKPFLVITVVNEPHH